MENDLELEDRILTMLSTQYEGIYQIDIDNDSVLCIYNRGLSDETTDLSKLFLGCTYNDTDCIVCFCIFL